MKKTTVFILFTFLIIQLSCNQSKTWDQVKEENSLTAFKEFLENNPETEHMDSVLLFIKQFEWEQIKKDTSLELLDSFKLKYAEDEVYKDSIDRIQVALDWKVALKKHTIEGYEKFLENHSKTSYKYSALGKIEAIKWTAVKNTNDKKAIIDFLADYRLETYQDSLDFKFEFKDFKGYKVEFEANSEEAAGAVNEKITLNFYKNSKVKGVIEGDQEGDNYFNSWSFEVRGEYDEEDLIAMESRFLGMSDEVDSQPDENWSELKLFFEVNRNVFVKDERDYILKEILRISEE